jgi:hypothetical protein
MKYEKSNSVNVANENDENQGEIFRTTIYGSFGELFGIIRMTNNLGRAGHSVPAAGWQPTRPASRGTARPACRPYLNID